jgi:hypothetical protein
LHPKPSRVFGEDTFPRDWTGVLGVERFILTLVLKNSPFTEISGQPCSSKVGVVLLPECPGTGESKRQIALGSDSCVHRKWVQSTHLSTVETSQLVLIQRKRHSRDRETTKRGPRNALSVEAFGLPVSSLDEGRNSRHRGPYYPRRSYHIPTDAMLLAILEQ